MVIKLICPFADSSIGFKAGQRGMRFKKPNEGSKILIMTNKNSFVRLPTRVLVLKRVKAACVSKILMRGQRSYL